MQIKRERTIGEREKKNTIVIWEPLTFALQLSDRSVFMLMD